MRNLAEAFIVKLISATSVALLVILAGCNRTSKQSSGGGQLPVLSGQPSAGSASATVAGKKTAIAEGLVELTFPDDWHEYADEHSYDLFYCSRKEDVTTGLFVWWKEDLAEGMTPDKLLQLQIADFSGKRSRWVLINDKSTEQVGSLRLTSVTYSGESETSRHYYAYTLIEFDDAPNTVAIAIQLVPPSKWTAYQPLLQRIVRSARAMPLASRPPETRPDTSTQPG